LGYFEIEGGLKIQPETRACIEVSGQPQRRVRSYAAALVDDLGNSRHWHAKIKRQSVHTEPERLHELGAEDFAGMDGRKEFLRLSHE
jgi:hypothetical protein